MVKGEETLAAFSGPYIAGTDANRTVKEELTAIISRRSARRRISVTDLLNPRQAFFDRTHPEIQPSAERRQAMLAGAGFHETFGRAISTEEFVEQLVEWQEIVGKIDIFEQIPIELKTTGALPTDVLAWRAGNVEQLGMYCVMVERPDGLLLYYRRAEFGRPAALQVYQLEFRDLPGIGAEMVRRRDLLRDALRTGTPDGLPRCEWFGRNCDYQGFCGCALAEPFERMVGPQTIGLAERPDLARRLMEGASDTPAGGDIRFWELVFPRKTALRRSSGAAEPETPEERMASLERRGFDEALNDAVWFGFPGEVRRVRLPLEGIWASILLFRGIPTVLRTNKREKEWVDRKRLAEVFPHFLDRLAFECALAGSERGRLIVYYAAMPEDKFMVYDLWFRNLPAIRAEMERRLRLLREGAPPDQLPACQPSWLFKYCEFAPGCGCGPGERSP